MKEKNINIKMEKGRIAFSFDHDSTVRLSKSALELIENVGAFESAISYMMFYVKEERPDLSIIIAALQALAYKYALELKDEKEHVLDIYQDEKRVNSLFETINSCIKKQEEEYEKRCSNSL